jgi:tripartite-type tricarboxylate transporter receptor subunit TctC
MTISGKTLSFVAFMAAMTPAVCAADADKAWPTRTVRIIVPIAAGGAIDAAARLYADGLSKKWGQPVVIENRPGAETNIGTAAFVSAHDDHTLLYGISSTITVNPLVYANMPFDPARDLVSISATASTIIGVAVHNSTPARSLSDLVRLARAEPGKMLWGAAPGLPRHAFAAFLKRHGLEMVYVPYRDVATPQADLGEGRIHVLVTSLQGTNAPVQSGKAHIVAVISPNRAPMLAEVPTAGEVGYPELTVDLVSGLFGWRDMPTALRDKISADVQAVAQDPAVRARIEGTGQLVLGSTPAEFTAAIERLRVRVGEIARIIDLKAANSK